MNVEEFDFESALKRLDGNEQLLQDMVGFFREDAPALLAEIDSGMQRNDLPAVRRASHSIKGLAASIGALRIPELAAELETLASANNMAGVRSRAEQLRALIDNAMSQLSK